MVSHVHCDVWGMRNNLRAWAEHYPVTLILVLDQKVGGTKLESQEITTLG